jgi:hypothetical protein
LWHTPVSVLTDNLPASAVWDSSCFTERQDAAVGAGVREGEEAGVGFAGLGAMAGVARLRNLGKQRRTIWSEHRRAERSHEKSPRELLGLAFHRFATD